MSAAGKSQLEIIRQELSTAILGDVLDALGRRRQFLPPQIRPLAPTGTLAGLAMPVLEVDAASDNADFGLMFEALDSLREGEVYVAAGGSADYAMWGELMTRRALACGAAGVVVDGFVRDAALIRELGFPAFSCGAYAQDQRGRGRVVEFRKDIRIGAVDIRPGDIVVGDDDGVLIVPRDLADDCIARALEKKSVEERIAREIEAGLTTAEAFKKYGTM